MTKMNNAFLFGSLKITNHWKWSILVLLLLTASAQFVRLENLWKDPQKAIDFRNIYIGAVLVSNGHDPYDDVAIKSCWSNIQKKEQLPENISPGLPTLGLLYPPLALYFGSVFTLFSYQNAVFVFKIILLLQLFVFPYLLARWLGNYEINIGVIPAFLLLIAAKPVINMINVGQPTLIFANLLLGAMCLVAAKRDNWRIHLLLFFGMMKPTVGGIIGTFYLTKWRKIATAVAIICSGFFIFSLMKSTAFSSYLVQAKGQVSAAYNPDVPGFPFAFEAMSNTQIDSVLALFHITGEIVIYLKVSLLILCVLFYLILRKRWEDPFSWLLPIILLSLVFTYHKYYDLILLLPYGILALLRGNHLSRLLGIWLLVHLLLPYKVLVYAGFPPQLADLLQFQNSIIPLVWIIALSLRPQVFRYQMV